MKKKFVSEKWIAFLLSLVLIVGSLPFNTIAIGSNISNESTEVSDSSELIADSQECTDDEVIGEIAEVTSLREENVKHFRLADGTYEAIVYSHSVHRKDENGVWQDIDNNLSLADDRGSQKYRTPDSRVKFTDSFKANEELFTFSENGYSISMMLESNDTSSKISLTTESKSVTESKPIVSNAPKRTVGKTFDSIEDAAKIDNRSSIVYNGVKANTNIEYVLRGNDIKENIIVSAPCESYDYQFQMKLVGLKAELDSNGNICLYDLQNGQRKYVIPAPYMYDSNGEYSTSVSYELKSVKRDVYSLKICADKSWINSKDRAFPVTIDPTLESQGVVWDSYTYKVSPNQNYGYDEKMWVSNYRTSYIYIENLPNLPSGATLNHASLCVPYYYDNNITEGGLLAGAYRVLEEWDESTITYNNAPAISTASLDTDILEATIYTLESTPGNACFIITDAVSDWYDDSSSNHGIAIKRESSSTYTNTAVQLKSYEANEERAYIIVNYTYYVPDGVYALQNQFSTTRWMTIEEDSAWAGKHVQQVYSASSPASTSVFDRSSLFKISRVGSTSRYIIRSMLNNNLSFGISGTEIVTKEIPSADSAVSVGDTFYIEWDGNGFLIRQYGSANVIKMASTSTANLTTVAKTSANSYARWNLVQYTGTNRQGLTIFRPSSWTSVGHIMGTTGTATLVGWSTYINANTLSMDVASGYEELGKIVRNSSSNQFSLSASNPGKIRLNGRIKYADGTQSHMGCFEYMIVPQEGTYYIQNASTEKFIDIAGPSNNVGAIIHQWQYHTGNQAKWNIEHVSNSGGYVRLKSVYSNLYIGVDSSNTSSIKQYNIQNDYTLWKIDRSTVGNLVFRCKATESGGIVLSVPLTANSNGTNLTQVTYSNDANEKDEWKLRSIQYSFTVKHYIDKGYEIRFNSTGQDISEYQNICSQILLELFGVDCTYTVSTYCSCADTCTGTPTTLLDTTTSCTHLNINHKTRSNIKNDIVSLYNSGNETTAKIAWTGHVLESPSSCSYAEQHVVIMTIGMVTNTSNNNEPPDVIRNKRIYTLLHEISHQLGAPDHYCYDLNSPDCSNPTNDCWRCDNGLSSPPDCIMTSVTYDIESKLLSGNADTLYCNQCKSSTHSKGILTHLEDHHK